MVYKFRHIFCLFCLFSCRYNKPVIVSSASEKEMVWNENRSLIWDDFQAPLQERNGEKTILTSSVIHISHFIDSIHKEKVIYYNVEAVFNKKSSYSYVKRKCPKCDRLLKDEQNRFNLIELYVRKVRKEIMDSVYKLPLKGINYYVGDILIRYDAENWYAQMQYDEETQNLNDSINQIRWGDSIDRVLKELDKYKNPLIKIKTKRNWFK